MQLNCIPQAHLGYCTNVHPGETLAEVQENLTRYVVPLRHKICPNQKLGVGLRLSYQAAKELQDPKQRELFRSFCQNNNLYIFTINGFIYGHFHGKRVKEEVYLPDWSNSRRLEYTNMMAHILVDLLPENISQGTISTCPGGFKNEVDNPTSKKQIAQNLLLHACELYRLEKQTGKRIVLALEPEPSCLLETTDETIAFFQDYLYSASAVAFLAQKIGREESFCKTFLHSVLGVCYDTCHLALAYENASESLQKLSQAQIPIAKVHISSALKARFNNSEDKAPQFIEQFQEPIYLHQVIEKRGSQLNRFTDLPLAFEHLKKQSSEPIEWRVHFHVPVFLRKMDNVETTQDYIIDTLREVKKHQLCQHFEVETYTWQVLPPQYQSSDLVYSLQREMKWAYQQLENL